MWCGVVWCRVVWCSVVLWRVWSVLVVSWLCVWGGGGLWGGVWRGCVALWWAVVRGVWGWCWGVFVGVGLCIVVLLLLSGGVVEWW